MSRAFTGAILIGVGVLAILFGAFWNLANFQDEGPRCLAGCPPSLLQYYWTVFEASTLLVVLGFIASVVGVRLLMRSGHPTKGNV